MIDVIYNIRKFQTTISFQSRPHKKQELIIDTGAEVSTVTLGSLINLLPSYEQTLRTILKSKGKPTTKLASGQYVNSTPILLRNVCIGGCNIERCCTVS